MKQSFHYKFFINGQSDEHFDVIEFTGREAVSSLFRYNIELKGKVVEDDNFLNRLINQSCRLEFYFSEKKIRTVHGIVSEVEEQQFLSDGIVYGLVLSPRISNLRHFDTNEVYLEQSVPDIITTIMDESGMAESIDYELDVSRAISNDKWPFKLQYKEHHLDYIQRITERDGVYYFFKNENEPDKHDVVVYSDSQQSNSTSDVYFAPLGSMEETAEKYQVNQFIHRSKHLPRSIRFRDFNEETPSQDIIAEKNIDDNGQGCINIYGLNIRNTEEAERLADTHAQAYLASQKQFIGEGVLPLLSAGHCFTLHEHPRHNYNGDYFVTEVELSGANTSYFQQDPEHVPANCQARFTAIKASQRFVPLMTAEKPEIKGTLHAVIDSDGSTGDHAMLDEFGRYKVKLPFDRKNNEDAKASHWIRMAQPFGGDNEGMHFPLRKGTHVLLSFIGGDPDRPVISSTIGDNVEQSSVVNEENHTNKIIQTSQGNKIEIEDQDDSNRIKLESPHSNTYLHLGAPNHDGSGIVMLTDGIDRIEAKGGQRVCIKTGIAGSSHTTSSTASTSEDPYVDFDFYKKSSKGKNEKSGAAQDYLSNSDELTGGYITNRTQGDTYKVHKGLTNEFYPDFALDSFEADSPSDTDNVPDNAFFSFGNRLEAHHKDNDGDMNGLIDAIVGYNLTGSTTYDTNNSGEPSSLTWQQTLENARVSVAQFDTITAQNGNIFDFGGYWNYNLGNSYAENYLNQTVEINKLYDGSVPGSSSSDAGFDLLKAGGPYWGTMTDLDDIVTQITNKPDSALQYTYAGGVGVEKTFENNSYEYNHLNTGIEVNYKCKSLEINYGNSSWEVTYDGKGTKRGEAKSGGGISEEWSSNASGSIIEYTKVDASDAVTGKEIISRTEVDVGISGGAVTAIVAAGTAGLTALGIGVAVGGGPGIALGVLFGAYAALFTGVITSSIVANNPPGISLAHYEHTHKPTPGVKHTYEFNGTAKQSNTATINLSATQSNSFELNLGISQSNSAVINLGMSQANSLSITGALENSINGKFRLGASLDINVVGNSGPEAEILWKNHKVEKCDVDLFGLKAKHEQYILEAKNEQKITMLKTMLDLQKNGVEIKKGDLGLSSDTASIDLSSIKLIG